MNNIKRILKKAAVLLFPPKCPACGAVTGSKIEGELCESCRKSFENDFLSVCPECGMCSGDCECAPKIVKSDADISPHTTVLPLVFSGYYTGYDAGSVSANLVYKMKRQHTSEASYIFARMMAQSLSRTLVIRGEDPKGFTVTYIPRSKSSIDKYGFDHMEIAAKTVANMLGCRFDSLLSRYGGTEQKELSAKLRQDNATESIAVNQRKAKLIRGTKIILLDDIVTSGASMGVAVTKLSFAGASLIVPACAMVSKTDSHNKKRK